MPCKEHSHNGSEGRGLGPSASARRGAGPTLSSRASPHKPPGPTPATEADQPAWSSTSLSPGGDGAGLHRPLSGSLGVSDDGGVVTSRQPDRSLLWPAVLVGVGVAGSLDEIVLHQLLRWHHFYDRGSAAAGVDRRRHLPSRLDCRAGRWTGVVGAPLAGGARAAATGGGGCPARGRRLQPVRRHRPAQAPRASPGAGRGAQQLPLRSGVHRPLRGRPPGWTTHAPDHPFRWTAGTEQKRFVTADRTGGAGRATVRQG